MSTVITWLDGRLQTVADDDPRIAEQERAKRVCSHILNLRRISVRANRQDYLANVARKEGQDAAQAVREAFLVDWEARQGGES